jgi:hypothetical protein
MFASYRRPASHRRLYGIEQTYIARTDDVASLTAITFWSFLASYGLALLRLCLRLRCGAHQSHRSAAFLGADKDGFRDPCHSYPGPRWTMFKSRRGDQAMNTIVEQIIRTFALAVVPPQIIDNSAPQLHSRRVRAR